MVNMKTKSIQVQDNRKTIAGIVQEWLQDKSGMIADIAVSNPKEIGDDEIVVSPFSQGASNIMIYVEYSGTFTLHVGQYTRFEGLEISKESILKVCEAIKEGKVSEEIWEWHNIVYEVKGKIEVEQEPLVVHRYIFPHFLLFFLFGKQRTIQYKAWI